MTKDKNKKGTRTSLTHQQVDTRQINDATSARNKNKTSSEHQEIDEEANIKEEEQQMTTSKKI